MSCNPYQLPSRYPVNSTDYLLLLFHRKLLKRNKTGNIVRTVLYSESVFPEEEIKASLTNNTLLQWLNSYSIENDFWGSPRYWIIGSMPVSVGYETVYSSNDEIPDSVLNFALDTEGKGLFYLHRIIFKTGGSALVLSVNHCFTDFRGVQMLVNILVGNFQYESVANWLSSPDIVPTFSVKLKESLKIVGFILQTILRKVAVIGNRSLSKTGNCFRVRQFSEAISAEMDKQIEAEGLSLQPNIFFLAKTIDAFQNATLIHSKSGLLWVTMPMDSRKIGVVGQLLGNSLWFLFYRLEMGNLGLETSSLSGHIAKIKGQTLDQLKRNLPKKYAIMASWWKNLPLPVYNLFVQMPALGKVSSLSFSNLGNTFPDLNEAFGCSITNIVNYPSNPSPPGIGVVVMKRKGKYSIVLSWGEDLIALELAERVLHEW